MAFLLLAFVVGVVVAVPPTGPINLLFYRWLIDRQFRLASVHLLSVVASDVFYAGLAVFGYAWLLGAYPEVSVGIQILGLLLVTGIGLRYLLAPPQVELQEGEEAGSLGAEVAQGLGVALLNPSNLLTWLIALDILHTLGAVDADLALWEQIGFPLAAGLGSAAWFGGVMLAWYRWVKRPSARVARLAIRGIGALLLAVAVAYGWSAFG